MYLFLPLLAFQQFCGCGGFLIVDGEGYLHLTDVGRKTAEKIYKRHQFFTEQLIAAGVNETTAEEDACRIDHAISDESFQKLQKYFMKPK